MKKDLLIYGITLIVLGFFSFLSQFDLVGSSINACINNGSGTTCFYSYNTLLSLAGDSYARDAMWTYVFTLIFSAISIIIGIILIVKAKSLDTPNRMSQIVGSNQYNSQNIGNSINSGWDTTTSRIYCSKCGTSNNSSSEFCPKCGNKLNF